MRMLSVPMRVLPAPLIPVPALPMPVFVPTKLIRI